VLIAGGKTRRIAVALACACDSAGNGNFADGPRAAHTRQPPLFVSKAIFDFGIPAPECATALKNARQLGAKCNRDGAVRTPRTYKFSVVCDMDGLRKFECAILSNKNVATIAGVIASTPRSSSLVTSSSPPFKMALV
jgi:hypothetical protein